MRTCVLIELQKYTHAALLNMVWNQWNDHKNWIESKKIGIYFSSLTMVCKSRSSIIQLLNYTIITYHISILNKKLLIGILTKCIKSPGKIITKFNLLKITNNC